MKKGAVGVSRFSLAPLFLFFSLFAYNGSSEELIEYARTCLINTSGTIDAYFFCPDQAHDIKRVMLGLMAAETEKITAALYRLTDDDIVHGLLDAKKRGVVVELIVDHGAINTAYYSKVLKLYQADIPVFVYQATSLLYTPNARYCSIMHHKTFVFECSIASKKIIVAGSLNPTRAGFHGNEEYVFIRDEPSLYKAFLGRVSILKQRSHLYGRMRPTIRGMVTGLRRVIPKYLR